MTQKSEIKVETVEEIHDFILRGINLDERRAPFSSDPFWKGLKDVGTELWLDTGDIEAADKLWKAEFSALTTNNTLLHQVQSMTGIQDKCNLEHFFLLAQFVFT